MLTVPLRYIPSGLSKKDRKKQAKMLKKSRKLYKQKKYYTRKALPSYKHKVSEHIVKARRMYKVDKIGPTKEFAQATGCSINALKQIIKKGQGAYFSSGSRPNQTPKSWGLARLASALTGGKAAAVDYDILERGCSGTNSVALKMAKQARVVYGRGRGATRKIKVAI